MSRKTTIILETPEDYDLSPVMHRLTELFEAVRGEASEEPPVPDDVLCPSLGYVVTEDAP